MDEAASYIIDHYDESLSLEMISDHFYADKCYLSRIFKEASGFTVNEYINMIRIRHARELLSSSSMSITEVSESVGYETITYFERVFNQYAQTSPSRYRKQYRLKNDF
ncbi:MAG: AraC family transcriptional regulator [Enterocloster clostridioformis]|uniref:helix-turn-helix domain-containing protein n=1 Tax=Enterocloster clostridioformis TaxID=1531 RepID=UPI001FA70F0E|nr:AraC family transcriptional regulator [Enterocloster clostridioformis]MCD7871709.1 AraC family transcriptional regulator [Enterocloster clostridioformis]MCI7611253.1 AraC family transcriptional regulator [Enterocloster clostridioformis]